MFKKIVLPLVIAAAVFTPSVASAHWLRHEPNVARVSIAKPSKNMYCKVYCSRWYEQPDGSVIEKNSVYRMKISQKHTTFYIYSYRGKKSNVSLYSFTKYCNVGYPLSGDVNYVWRYNKDHHRYRFIKTVYVSRYAE